MRMRALRALALLGLAAGIAAVATFAMHPATKGISFLWQNPLGVIVVLIVGTLVSVTTGGSRQQTRS